MKKKIMIIAAAVIALICVYAVGSGFTKETSVYISDFSLSEDGTAMDISISAASSVGYVRKIAPRQEQDGTMYLDCYSAFGGLNGSIGARSEYTLHLDEDTKTIAVCRDSGRYEEVLRKDEDGIWQRISRIPA